MARNNVNNGIEENGPTEPSTIQSTQKSTTMLGRVIGNSIYAIENHEILICSFNYGINFMDNAAHGEFKLSSEKKNYIDPNKSKFWISSAHRTFSVIKIISNFVKSNIIYSVVVGAITAINDVLFYDRMNNDSDNFKYNDALGCIKINLPISFTANFVAFGIGGISTVAGGVGITALKCAVEPYLDDGLKPALTLLDTSRGLYLTLAGGGGIGYIIEGLKSIDAIYTMYNGEQNAHANVEIVRDDALTCESLQRPNVMHDKYSEFGNCSLLDYYLYGNDTNI